jgi:hypothetical protein
MIFLACGCSWAGGGYLLRDLLEVDYRVEDFGSLKSSLK